MLMLSLWLFSIFLHRDCEMFNFLCFHCHALNIEIVNFQALNAKPHHKLTCLSNQPPLKQENEFFFPKLPWFHNSTSECNNVMLSLTTTQVVLKDQFLW